MGPSTFRAAYVLPFVLALACGSKRSDDVGTPPLPPPTVDTVCDRFPADVCAARTACCQTAGVGFDSKGCLAAETKRCQSNAAEAKGGTMTFHQEKFADCVAGLQKWWNKCRLSVDDLLGWYWDTRACTAIWDGQLGQGVSCDRDEQCAGAPDGRVVVACGAKGCVSLYRFVGLGEECSKSSSPNLVCEPGLYCASDLPTSSSGKCAAVVGHGQACDPAKGGQLACGPAWWCDPATSTCAGAVPDGSTCASNPECASRQCNDASGKCEPAKVLADNTACRGP